MSLDAPTAEAPTTSRPPADDLHADDLGATPAPPPASAAARWWRRPGVLLSAAVVGLLALVVFLTVLATDSSEGGTLDPRSADPEGTLALAELLRERGIDSSRGGAPQQGGTLVVPFAGRLEPAELTRILDAARPAARVVLLGPEDVPEIGLMRGRLDVTDVRAPNCPVPAAQTAGEVLLGGRTYSGGTLTCYDRSLVVTQDEATQVIVLGSPTFLTNDELDDEGNAALALGLLSGSGLAGEPSTSVTWYQPSLDPAADPPGLLDLLPGWVGWACLQLALAVALLALWRGRRFGPVVEEPLPVVVPAAETVEGRARLYAAGKARGAAAEALRAGARARLGGALDHGAEPDPQGLVTAVAARSGRQPGEIAALLYGSAQPAGTPAVDTAAADTAGAGSPRAAQSVWSVTTGQVPGLGEQVAGTPGDDAALVRLADEIDRLEREVRAR